MSYTVPHTWVAGDFIRASWLQIATADLIDHEARMLVLEAAKVTGQSSSVDSEIALFSSTSGKALKRATATGMLKATAGVLAAATAGTDYVSPTGAEVLTNKTLTTPILSSGVQLGATRVTLTDAQIKALPTTGISIVAAQGAGKVIRPLFAFFTGDFSAGAYTNINAGYSSMQLETNGQWAALAIVNDSTTSPALSQLSSFLAAHAFIYEMPPTQMESFSAAPASSYVVGQPLVNSSLSGSANQALKLVVDNSGSGNYAGGNAANSLIVTVVYVVIG